MISFEINSFALGYLTALISVVIGVILNAWLENRGK